MPPSVTDETRAAIIDFYQRGKGSIQDYARIYHLSVEQVLEIVGESNLGEVEIIGDQVDASEMGKHGASDIKGPTTEDVPFSTN